MTSEELEDFEAEFKCQHEHMTGIQVFYPSGAMGQVCIDCGIGITVMGEIVEGLMGS